MPDLDRQPTLVSSHLILRPLEPTDWDGLFMAARDPLIWAVHPAHDRWQEPVFRRYFDDALASGGALAITHATSGEIIGSSRYDHRRAGPEEVEIGWTFIVRRFWGGPANALLKRMMVSHALQSVERVIFVVGEHNLRSRRAMEKIGGRLTDRIIEAQMAAGTSARHVVYAIGREEFAKVLLGGGGS